MYLIVEVIGDNGPETLHTRIRRDTSDSRLPDLVEYVAGTREVVSWRVIDPQ